MTENTDHIYNELYPSEELDDFISSYFEAKNLSKKHHHFSICPDGYVKLIIQLVKGKVVRFIMTGLWTKELDIVTPPGVVSYGIRLKIIAPEYILHRDTKETLNNTIPLDFNYLNFNTIEFTSFENVVKQIEAIFLKRLALNKEIRPNRLRLSQLLYNTFGDIQAQEVAKQIFWSHREINRYLNKYVGISLKKYLNVQKCYRAYLQIREGEFFPEKGFFDQAHFIREVKKHTGQTPRTLYQKQNDQFIQLKNIKKL
ncbi:hypothetical protein M0D21_11615 [Aquimarina sp. D1M17]|uniref:DUF6597 domain-containing transcriptional factor n=1 Tax=Aquimarina acroporae TaxID=2937283 RepID=UPI0020C13022|nr:DUF6597 domain-containing transcriptional factor [Aquimarina acroporae]MCK8522222.1 hypothetical protein [Aquimarina acroporae]